MNLARKDQVAQKGTSISTTQMRAITPPRFVLNCDAVLEEAVMELNAGGFLNDVLHGRLEVVSRDHSLPVAKRARALSLMSRFG